MTDSTDYIDPDPDLIRPTSITVDGSVAPDRARVVVRAAQLLYTFWNTGDAELLDRSNEPTFIDNTLPPGRPQGPDGVAGASKQFRAAVPDLTCELADLIAVDDRFAARLRFRGTFTGTYNGIAGQGQQVDFIAFDIQHVAEQRIDQDWHLEDNLTFLTQIGLVTIAGS